MKVVVYYCVFLGIEKTVPQPLAYNINKQFKEPGCISCLINISFFYFLEDSSGKIYALFINGLLIQCGQY